MKEMFCGVRYAGFAVLLLIAGVNTGAQSATESTVENSSKPATDLIPPLMSLSQALALANSQHPELLKYTAESQTRQADALSIGLDKRWRTHLTIDARTADLLNDDDRFKNDSRAGLTISKLLWDFGRSATRQELAAFATEGAQISMQYAQRLQRIEVMRQYFSVLAADYQFAADNESMTLAFFPFNRAQERSERFNSVSEVEVLEKRSAYLAELAKRNQSIRRQRATRFQLALAMGHPQAKPDGLIDPDLTPYARELPDFDSLLDKVLDSNPLIRRERLELAEYKAGEALLGASEKPEVNLELSTTAYEQSYRTRDRARAIISLDIPVFTGKLLAAERAGLAAQIAAKEAEVTAMDYEVREQVLEWVQSLEALNQEITQYEQTLEYTERALDKARLLYEMEVSAQIGRAQADMAKILWLDARAKYERALIWEQIDAVLGAPLVEFKQ